MPLNGANGQSRIFGNGFQLAANYTVFAVGVRQKVEIRPEARSHRPAMLAALIARQSLPDRRPPAFAALFKPQLLLPQVGNFANDLTKLFHKFRRSITGKFNLTVPKKLRQCEKLDASV